MGAVWDRAAPQIRWRNQRQLKICAERGRIAMPSATAGIACVVLLSCSGEQRNPGDSPQREAQVSPQADDRLHLRLHLGYRPPRLKRLARSRARRHPRRLSLRRPGGGADCSESPMARNRHQHLQHDDPAFLVPPTLGGAKFDSPETHGHKWQANRKPQGLIKAGCNP